MKKLKSYFIALILLMAPISSFALDITSDGKWQLNSVIRLRFEDDWDGIKANGISTYPDRQRIRVKANTELQYKPTSEFTFGTRLSLGDSNQNSVTNVTLFNFQGTTQVKTDVFFDKWYARVDKSNWWAWGGRNVVPFWQQNDYFWDYSAVTVAGGALGHAETFGNKTLSFNLGGFALPDGSRNFNGQLVSTQVVGTLKQDDKLWTSALGLFQFYGGKNGLYSYYGTGVNRGDRDYRVAVLNLQYRYPIAGRPLIFGADGYWNTQDYSANNPSDVYAAKYRNQVLGGLLSVQYGTVSKAKEWLVAYSYAYIEALAINPDFGQTDWTRATQSINDNKGHEFRAGYAINDKLSLSSRLFLVEGVSTKNDSENKRVRLDLTYKF